MKNYEQKILILAVWMSVSSGTIAQQAAVGSSSTRRSPLSPLSKITLR